MVAYSAAARRLRHWGAERDRPAWVGVLAQAAVILAAIGIGIFILYAAEVISGVRVVAMVVALAALAGLVGVAAIAAHWVHGGLEGRVDILSQALEASPDAQLIVGPDGRMAYANSAFISLFAPDGGVPLDRLAAAVADLEAGIDFQRLRSQAMAGARAIAAVPLKDARGAVAGWFNVAVNPIPGRPGYSFWHIQDITARHEMERVIRDERNRLVDFLDEAPIGFYSVDADGRFLFVNPTLARWLGATPAELVGADGRIGDFLAAPPSEGALASDPFGGRAGDAQRGEVVLKSRDGRIVHAWIGQSVVGSGDELRTHSIVRDLTPEREWEAALRLSRERFQRFFANAPIGIALIDRFGRLEEANRALGELFGMAQGDLIGQPLIGLGRLDGVEGGDGGLMLHFIDVTEQKNLEIQFAQSQKMQAVGQLAGGVAHDFNNLLTAMIGFCDLLLMRFKPGDPSFADIMQIKQNANRAANLVRQLLAFSRQQTLQPRILDITDVLVELSHLLRRLIGENIELKVVHGRDLGLAKVDQGQLEQVIINLAVNARDAMPGGGTLTIRTANHTQTGPMRRGAETLPAGNYLLIEVVDTGIGIPRENLERIFEPFFSTKEIGSGTGLGLSTVYGIVKQTGGFIFVDSAKGQGSVFQIYLPRYQQSDIAAAARTETGEPPAVKDLTGVGTVILVEDEDPVRIFGARALRNKGYTVLEARSGEAALELMDQTSEKIDLLITDVVMPKMDGPGLVREVRETHPDMKVIFISGYTEDSFRQRLDSDSNIHFLPKPFSLKQLATKVKEVISGEVA
jgi:two-component system, cell cycle sensor histidine kinase and response regulator CckA